MTNWVEIAGISLQIAAGLVFILDQVAHKFQTSLEKLTGRVIAFVTGKGKRRWRIIVLFSLVALPVILIVLTKLGTNEEITWFTIFGVLIFTFLGFYLYALLLILVGKRTLRGEISQHINSLIDDEKIISVNVKVLIISSVFIAGISLFLIYAYPKLDNFRLEIFLTFIIYPCMMVFTFAWVFSFLFLLAEYLLRFIKKWER